MRASRFLGSVSSSPIRTSMIRSYHFEVSLVMAYCAGAENAFGANSAVSKSGEPGLGESGGRLGADNGTFCANSPCLSGVNR